jgi:hypothetical protein
MFASERCSGHTSVRRSPRCLRAMLASPVLVVIAAVSINVAVAQELPIDAQPTVTVPPATFAGWFASGTPTTNGFVKPADSVAFSNSPNGDFYRWSEQMFLWATSPVNNGGTMVPVFASSLFYNVLTDAQGNYTLNPQTGRALLRFNLRADQPGPNGLPVVTSKSGKLFEVVSPKTENGRPMILSGAAKRLGVSRFALSSPKTVTFFDPQGNAIPDAKPEIPANLPKSDILQKIEIDHKIVFLDASGQVVDVSVGQATTNGVLLSQTGSLIYYGMAVNDVYAYFLTQQKDAGAATSTFPTTQAELNAIIAFAGQHQKTFTDPNALAIEIKTAWVETKGLPDAGDYIRLNAAIPTFDTTNPNDWKPNGEKTAELALIGIHIVGSANGHPEMIWSTFEHFGNSPNAEYAYNSTGGPKTVPQSTLGRWLLCATGAAGGGACPAGQFNAALQSLNLKTNEIQSTASTGCPAVPIGPSNTLRSKAFGASADKNPNPLDTPAASNTEIISINNSVLGQLVGGDIRKRYFFVGSTWTIGGDAPFPFDGSSFFDPNNAANGNAVGTSQLANSTMETFRQGPDNKFLQSVNCFSCHRIKGVQNANTPATTGVSHIFGKMKPLF